MVVPGSIRFCVGFPTLCQGPRNLFIYLFVHEKDLLVTWFLFGVQCAEKTGFELVFLHSELYGGHFSFQLWDQFGEVIRNFIFVSRGFLFPR